MKRIFPVLLLLFLWPAAAVAEAGNEVRIVYDGDTVLLENGVCVRYLGIDTPEIGRDGRPSEALAEAARAFNARAVRGRTIRLELDREHRDRHDRLLAYVYLPDGRMLNAELVRRGLARVLAIRPNLRHLERLIESQREAMERRSGLWGRPLKDGGPYLGSRRSFRFHRTDCPYAGRIHERNRIRFETKREAFWEGYSPCSRCGP